MKIICTIDPVNVDELNAFLQKDINTLFKERRQKDINLILEKNAAGIQMTCPALYESFLFDIQVINGTEIHIIKSEHYTDDVNVLTLEDIINNLMLSYPGRDNIDHIAEES